MIEPKSPACLEEWLAAGQQDPAAMAIVCGLSGMPVVGTPNVPDSTASIAACVSLLEAVPDFRKRLRDMASLGRAWAVVSQYWPDIEAVYRQSPYRGFASVRALICTSGCYDEPIAMARAA